MNYLAHIFLSNNNENIAIGNFIADTIKGKQYLNYPREIQKGILLHRAIDSYTDEHVEFKKSKQKLYQSYRHYSGVIVDIFYDHFLAKNWNKFHNTDLLEYTLNFYELLKRKKHLLPEKIIYMMPFIIEQNWLYNYKHLEGIENVLIGMNRRTQGKSNMHLSIKELNAHYNTFENEFFIFFKDVLLYSKEILKNNSK